MKTSKFQPKISPLGDSAIAIFFEDVISESVLNKVMALEKAIKKKPLAGTLETITGYNSLTLYYNPLLLSYQMVSDYVLGLLNHAESLDNTSKTIRIPVYYDGQDLDFVCRHTKLTKAEVIKRHTAPTYKVYMLGFSPGFPYIGGMDSSLATPRKKVPALHIKAGSVGIANQQTGIYTTDGPGGWQIIGRTPLDLFDATRKQPALLSANDNIVFYSITKDEWEGWSND